MATRSKAQAEKLLQQQLEDERVARLLEEERLLALQYGGDDEPDAYAKIRSYCSTVGTDDSLGIYRQLPQKQEMFICKIDADEFDPETIKARFGGGTFIIKGYDDHNKIRLRQFISIEGDPIVETNKPALALVPVDPPFNMQSLLAILQENNKMLLASIAQSQPQPKTTVQVLEEMKLMRDIFAPAAAPQTNLVEMLKLGMSLQGGGGDNAWVGQMIEVFGKPIVEGMVAAKAQGAVPATPARPAIAAPVAAHKQTEEEPAVNIILRGYIKMVATAAAANEDVIEYADTILNMVPASQLPEVEALLRADDWQTKMAAYTPAVNQYPVWFANLRNTLIQFIDSDRLENLTAGGDGGRVSGHEDADTDKTPHDDNPGGST
jgi:hypothetical protein